MGRNLLFVLIGDENANHAFDVRLKEPYNENLKRLNEFVENTYPNISLRFILVDYMVKDIYKDVYRFLQFRLDHFRLYSC